MKLFPLTIILMIGLLSSCGVLYKNDASKPIKAGDIRACLKILVNFKPENLFGFILELKEFSELND